MTTELGPDARPDGTGSATYDPQEVARLRAERDSAVAALARNRRSTRRRGTARRVLAGLLVFLFALLVPITFTATWAHRTVLNTDAYVSTVAPVATDPAVTAAVSRQITNQLYDALDPQQIIAEALPPRAAFLAGPIASGAKSRVQEGVNKVLDSDQFEQLWLEANRFAHAQLVAVLRGDSKVFQVTSGQVVLNLVPLLNEALKNTQDFVSGVVGKPVTLPAVSGNEPPSVLCEKISAALDRPVPETCGQIALFPAKKLVTAQRAVQVFDRAVLALLILTPLLAVAALWVSTRRRRTLLQLTVGGMLGLVIVRRALMWEQNSLVAMGRPENKEARSAIVHQVLSGFFDISLWLLVAGLVVVAVALLTGPYRWAVALRRGTVGAVKKCGALVSAGFAGGVARAQDEATVAWVRRHFDALRIGGVVVALLLLLVLDVNIWGFLIIAALAAVYEMWLYRLRPPAEVVLPPPTSAPPAEPPMPVPPQGPPASAS